MKALVPVWFIVEHSGSVAPRLLPWTGSYFRNQAWDAHLHNCAGWSEADFAGHTKAKERIRLQRQRRELRAVKVWILRSAFTRLP